MIILTVIAAIFCIAGYFVAKVVELRRDVLYGRYIESDDRLPVSHRSKRRDGL
jgi:hypothetical protein